MRQILTDQQPRAFNMAFQLTRNEDSARELAQEASVRAIEKWGCYDARRPFAPWLLTILKNRYLDGLRSARLTRSIDAPASDADGDMRSLLENCSDDSESPLDQLLCKETRKLVRRVLAGLPAACRRVLVMCDMNDESYETVALALGVPRGTVCSRLYRARRLFRERFVRLEESGASCV
jgi:RNA polymerase sigma-70 factor (ECF subfamily)